MNLKVIILAGGRAERLWPLSDKALISFLGKPLIVHQIERLKKAGFKDLVVVGNQKNLSFIKKFGVKAVLQKGSGQGAAILSAEKLVKNQRLLVINGNDFFEESLFRKAARLTSNPQVQGFLTGFVVQSYFPGGYLIVKDKLVKGVVEKPDEGKEPSNMVRLVVDYFENVNLLLNSLKKIKKERDDVYELAIDKMIKGGTKFRLLKYEGRWGYLKLPWHTLALMEFFLEKIKQPEIDKSVKKAENVFIQGPVVIKSGVRIFENAKILGPTFIGENTIVGNNAVVRHSMIGKNCVVGFSTEIARSYVGEGCWFHSNYVGDSVLDENVSLGAGAVLANLRLDEGNITTLVRGEKVDTKRSKLGAIIGKNVRLGVNSSIMPGIKIGKNSFVGAGVVLNKDLGENKFCCLQEQNLKITKNTKTTKDEERNKFREKILKA